MSVDISGLDKASVIQALYEGSRPQGLGFLQYQSGGLDRADAESLVDHYIDYLRGRVMKLFISADSDTFDEGLYDRDNGRGAAQRIVDAMRAGVASEVAAKIHEAGKRDAAQIALEDMGQPFTVDHSGDVSVFRVHLPDDPALRDALSRH